MKTQATTLLSMVILMTSICSVGHASLTVRGENDEAVIALSDDVNSWITNEDKTECDKGKHILESAREFVQTPTLTTDQKADAEKASENLQQSLNRTCNNAPATTASIRPSVETTNAAATN